MWTTSPSVRCPGCGSRRRTPYRIGCCCACTAAGSSAGRSTRTGRCSATSPRQSGRGLWSSTTAWRPNTRTRLRSTMRPRSTAGCSIRASIRPRIAFAGDSCGGGLVITTQLRAREQGLPLPAAALPFSPWVDMEVTGDSYDTNRDRDAFFHRDLVRDLATLYVGAGGDPRDPLVNPLYGDLTGFGPIYIQVGGGRGAGRRCSAALRTRPQGRRRGAARCLPRHAAHLPDGGRPGSRGRRCDSRRMAGLAPAGAAQGAVMTGKAEFERRTEPFRRGAAGALLPDARLGRTRPRTWCRRRTCGRGARTRLRRPLLAAGLALPHRHQRLPDRARAARQAGAARRVWAVPATIPTARRATEPEVAWLEPIPDALVGLATRRRSSPPGTACGWR